MQQLPIHIYLTFFASTLFTIILFFKASHYQKTAIGISLAWLLIQGLLAYSGFYSQLNTSFPKPVLMVAPVFVFIIFLFLNQKGKQFIDGLDLKSLCIIHFVRIPVELVLFWLYLHKGVPQLMTFEGRNFDVLSGLSAPLVYYFGFVKNKLNIKTILIWNYVCLILLLNIVINAILSLPLPFQQFAFDQPNIAVLYFPFVWLPSLIVPLVLFSPLASIKQLQAKLN
jgi:hypothetical protein